MMTWWQFQQTDPYVLIPFLGYMLGVVVIAVVAHRYQRAGEFEAEYYVGGRSFGAWVLAFSWVATLASGGSFLGYPSLVYSYGWSMAFWVSGSTVTALVGLGVVGKRINRLARQTGALTLVDMLRDRYQSHAVGVVYASVIVFVTTVYLTAQFVAGARILESLLGTSYLMGLLLFGVSVVAYTTYGGFRAVAWTDTLQGIVMIVGIVLLVPFTLSKVGSLKQATLDLATRQDPVMAAQGRPSERHAYLYPPGPQTIRSAEPAATDSEPAATVRERNRFLTGAASEARSDPWLPIGVGISLFMLRSLGAVMMPTTVPRMLAFRDTRALRRALLLLAPYFLLMYGSSLISLNCAHSLNLGLAPDESDRAVPELAQAVAPPLLAGVLLAAPFAAVMSTVDSALLVISSSVVRDLVQKTFYPGLSEHATRWLSYAVTGGAGVSVFLFALTEPPFLQPLVIYYVAGGASSLFWPSLATLYWKRATAPGVIAGLAGGAAVFVLYDLFRPLDAFVRLHPFLYGFAASAVLCGGVSLLTRRQTERELLPYFGKAPERSGR